MLQEKAIQSFENQLDIRSLVKTRIDLSILLSSLLNKQQLLLFHSQHTRAFTTYDSSSANEGLEEELQNHDFVEMPRDKSAL